jgi:hypothetical protein
VLSAGNGTSHLVGNRDTRGQCTASAAPSAVNTCSVAFSASYGTTPTVVVTPVDVAPSEVMGYSVHATPGGFTISFTVSHAGAVTFNYMVEG